MCSVLKKALEEKRFQDADNETRSLLIRQAGPDAVKRGWVYFTEIRTIPVVDMATVDGLWKAYSNGKFGYSVQRELWLQNRKQWPRFFKAINWLTSENQYLNWPGDFVYTMDAKKGHLPLVNALRGTNLFEEIFTHPAINKQKETKKIGGGNGASGGAGGGSDKPSWL